MILSFLPDGSHFVVGGHPNPFGGFTTAPVRIQFFRVATICDWTKRWTFRRTQTLSCAPTANGLYWSASQKWFPVPAVRANVRFPVTGKLRQRCVEVWRRKGKQWGHVFELKKPEEDSFIRAAQFIDDHRVLEAVNCRQEPAEQSARETVNSPQAAPRKDKWRSKLLVVDLDTQQTIRQTTSKISTVRAVRVRRREIRGRQ